MDVKKVASLARLKLKGSEESEYKDQLVSICDFFEKISALDTKGVEPLVTPTDLPSELRQDKAEDPWSADEALSNAPEKAGHLFKVPPVV